MKGRKKSNSFGTPLDWGNPVGSYLLERSAISPPMAIAPNIETSVYSEPVNPVKTL